MSAPAPTPRRGRAMLVASLLVLAAGPAPAQILPWEMTVTEVETGRIRSLAQRLSKQNLLYELRIDDLRKSDLAETATEIDRIIVALSEGRPQRSIPAPWTPALRDQVQQVDRVWGPIRAIALADAHRHHRIKRQFAPADSYGTDPLLVRHFDRLTLELVAESEKLLGLYHAECRKTKLDICDIATQVGYSEMLLERATKEAIYVHSGIAAKENRKRLAETVAAYEQLVDASATDPFLASAIDPARGPTAKALGELIGSLQGDWNSMARQLRLLEAGDEANFDVGSLLLTQRTLVSKIERVTAALMRYATLTFGA